MTVRHANVPARTHGRILIEAAEPTDGGAALVVGFHGYAQHAAEMLDELRQIAPAGWTLVSVQGLHRFYRPRTQLTVASWMTREDREMLIADNVAYVDAVVAQVVGAAAVRSLVYCGFSQGAAMAFRAAALGRVRPRGIVALGGDVPPELLQAPAATFPATLLARGDRDMFYTAARLASDAAALTSRGVPVETLTFDGAHEWTPAFRSSAAQFLGRVDGRGGAPRSGES